MSDLTLEAVGHNRALDGIKILAPPAVENILTPDALEFVATLHREFNPTRKLLLSRRAERQAAINAGTLPDFLPETKRIREGEWQVAPIPSDLQKRWVEITGPTERKMMINALNSGASVFMADFEDALSPTWDNVVQGQINLIDAIRRQIDFVSPEGKTYKLHLSSIDLLHGFSIQPINLNLMVLPGYDYIANIRPTTTGDFRIICNEFCGVGHHTMVGKIEVI